jgi:hypothetical protein
VGHKILAAAQGRARFPSQRDRAFLAGVLHDLAEGFFDGATDDRGAELLLVRHFEPQECPNEERQVLS